jgi:hypothetical protein
MVVRLDFPVDLEDVRDGPPDAHGVMVRFPDFP